MVLFLDRGQNIAATEQCLCGVASMQRFNRKILSRKDCASSDNQFYTFTPLPPLYAYFDFFLL